MHRITRRRVLETVATGGVAAGTLGSASGRKGPERYVVGTASPRAERAAKAGADRVNRVHDFGDIGKAVAGRFPERAAERLANRPDVRYVEVEGRYRAIGETLPWGVDRVDADRAHAEGHTGDGADLAILDTGIDSDHPDLEANLGKGKAYVDSTTGPESWDDDNGHGTHCAGIADAVDDDEGVVGISTAATLHAVKVLDSDGYGYYSDIAAGLEWVANRGYDVASVSIGGTSGSYTIRDACRYAVDSGVLVVAAAGNDGEADSVRYPAAYSTVVAVSATDSSDDLAYFSSYGPEVELAAPGYSIYSTVPGGYGYRSGTSMACPHVAGAGGQLMAGGLSNTEARQTLRDTAEDVGLSDDEQGYGLLDVGAAVDSLGSSDPSVAVSTDPASSVGTDSATLDGTLEDLGGASSADVYFEYGESGSGLTNTTATQARSSTGSFDATVSGLASGTDYVFRAVADASDGDADAGETNGFTTDSTDANAAPDVDSYAVSEAGSPNPHAEITADWSVTDGDGNLSAVTVVVTDSDGGRVDSAGTGVSGSSASGSDSFKIKHARNGPYDVTLTATDTDGADASVTRTVTA